MFTIASPEMPSMNLTLNIDPVQTGPSSNEVLLGALLAQSQLNCIEFGSEKKKKVNTQRKKIIN